MARTIRLLLAYDGTGFRGWAAQGNKPIRTVEGTLAPLLSAITGERVKLSVAGRTDAGVHARGQVASFTTTSQVTCERLRKAIDGRLGPEVAALSVREVPAGFDARFSASARVYRYRVNVGPTPDPFQARFVWHHPCAPDLRAMRAAVVPLIGSHDFTSFCRHPGVGKPTVRNLQRVSIVRRGDVLELGFRANAFLHQMVRSLTGTLVAVGEGKLDPGSIPTILGAKDRRKATYIAPPHGLTLERVLYGRREPHRAPSL